MLLDEHGKLLVAIDDTIKMRNKYVEQVRTLSVDKEDVHCIRINHRSYSPKGGWITGREGPEDIIEVIKAIDYAEEHPHLLSQIKTLELAHAALAKENKELKAQIPAEGTLEWAISQMRQGKKVRLRDWLFCYYISLDSYCGFKDEKGQTYKVFGLDNDWQLFEEPKKELAVGQTWLSVSKTTREIIAIRNGIVTYFYNGRNEPDSQRENYFLEKSAHKLISETK